MVKPVRLLIQASALSYSNELPAPKMEEYLLRRLSWIRYRKAGEASVFISALPWFCVVYDLVISHVAESVLLSIFAGR